MSPTMRALLVASPYGQLEGPENDVEMMAGALQKRGFLLQRCCGQEAKREEIRARWKRLISEASTDDVIVIYYSGHGGAALPEEEEGNISQQRRLQFIVPMDYGESPGAFSGISEVELSQLLLETTNKTQNVTIIFDCCHSGRMVRDPRNGRKAIRKNLPTTLYHNIASHITQLQQEGVLPERAIPDPHAIRVAANAPWESSNPHAVRISAAAPWESAYEYESVTHGTVGAFTEALVRVLEETDGHEVTWKTTMLRAQELVNIFFPEQHPRVEGPQTRFLFSLERQDSGALVIKQEGNDRAIIQAGRVAGVRENNMYAVMPPGSERVDMQEIIATADVIKVSGFSAKATLDWKNGAYMLRREGALAFLIEEAPHKLSVSVPDGSIFLRNQVESSKFLRCYSDDVPKPLLEFQEQDGKLTLRNQRGVLLFSERFNGGQPSAAMCRAAVTIADNVVRARLFQAQACDSPDEEFHHDVKIQVRLVQDNDSERAIEPTGEESIPENSELLITLYNHDPHVSAFVSVFEVEENGQINAISANPDGIDLRPQQRYTIYRTEVSRDGLQVIWPDNIPKAQAVVETLVFVISSAPVNLQFLANPELAVRGDAMFQSSLGHRLSRLAQGRGRKIGREKQLSRIRYDIVQWPFFLEPVELAPSQ